MELYQYASQVKSTKGYYIIYQDQSIVISTSKKDPDIIISIMDRSKKTYMYEIKHIRISKILFIL